MKNIYEQKKSINDDNCINIYTYIYTTIMNQ